MVIDVFWDNPEHTIIRQEIRGRWTSEEYTESVFLMYGMMQTVPHSVHIVVDMRQIHGSPTRMIAAAPRFNAHLPLNRGLTVGINIPAPLVSIVRVASRIYPRLGRNVHFVSTLESAYDVIQRYGSHLL